MQIKGGGGDGGGEDVTYRVHVYDCMNHNKTNVK